MKPKETDKFEYSYSAKEQEEIRKIRDKYLPPKEDKLQQLRRLDAEASKPGTIAAIIVGIIGILLFGFGMACTLEWSETMFVPGIIIGIIGIFAICLAHPLYQKITKKHREKIAPLIQKLTDELMQK